MSVSKTTDYDTLKGELDGGLVFHVMLATTKALNELGLRG